MIHSNDELILAYNPFEGDFGDQGDRKLKDKMGIARKPGPCSECQETIQPGTRIRLLAGVYDGNLRSYRWCTDCCTAMAASWSDSGLAIEARHALRAIYQANRAAS